MAAALTAVRGGGAGASAGRAAVWPPCRLGAHELPTGLGWRRLRSQELHQACKCGGAVHGVESCGEQLVSSRIALVQPQPQRIEHREKLVLLDRPGATAGNYELAINARAWS